MRCWCREGTRSKISREELLFSNGVVPSGVEFDLAAHRSELRAALLRLRLRRFDLRDGLAVASDHHTISALGRLDQLGESSFGLGDTYLHTPILTRVTARPSADAVPGELA